MYITVLGVRYPLGGVVKPFNRFDEAQRVAEILAIDMGIAERRIIATLNDKSITDKHTATAAQLFGVEECKVTAKQRAVGKQRNFLILYGANDL